MEGFDWNKIFEYVFPLLTTFFAAYWALAKAKISAIAKLIATVDSALSDNKITAEEMKTIVSGVMKVLGKEVPLETKK